MKLKYDRNEIPVEEHAVLEKLGKAIAARKTLPDGPVLQAYRIMPSSIHLRILDADGTVRKNRDGGESVTKDPFFTDHVIQWLELEFGPDPQHPEF